MSAGGKAGKVGGMDQEPSSDDRVSRRAVLRAGATAAWAVPVVMTLRPSPVLAVSPVDSTDVEGRDIVRPGPGGVLPGQGSRPVAAAPAGQLARTGGEPFPYLAAAALGLTGGVAALAQAKRLAEPREATAQPESSGPVETQD